jgi:predicted transcriptional regulator
MLPKSSGTAVPACEFRHAPNITTYIFNPYMSERKNNRGKIEIMADVLSLSTAGIKKTHIMYRANLSYEQILYYLGELMGKGLIGQDVDDGALVYRTTEKGREFLACYSRMSDIISGTYGGAKVPLITT